MVSYWSHAFLRIATVWRFMGLTVAFSVAFVVCYSHWICVVNLRPAHLMDSISLSNLPVLSHWVCSVHIQYRCIEDSQTVICTVYKEDCWCMPYWMTTDVFASFVLLALKQHRCLFFPNRHSRDVVIIVNCCERWRWRWRHMMIMVVGSTPPSPPMCGCDQPSPIDWVNSYNIPTLRSLVVYSSPL